MLHWEGVLTRESVLLMVGPYGDWVRYSYDGPLLLLPEMDCVRLVSATATVLLIRVAEPTEQLLKPASLAPAARLLEASEAFTARSARADELLRGLGSELAGAVACCIEAAELELQPALQQLLLRAAAYGKCYLPSAPSPPPPSSAAERGGRGGGGASAASAAVRPQSARTRTRTRTRTLTLTRSRT